MEPIKSDASHGVPSLYRTPVITRHFERTSQYVQMDDGTRLAVEVYLPKLRKHGEKLPTILEQTRYWRLIQIKFPLKLLYPRLLSLYRQEFISHGYAWVAVDSRGAGASFGSRPWEFSPVEIDDSRQIIDWILKQPWSNGSVGTIGHSFSGNMAEFTLLTKHPAVKAAAVLSSPFDLYSDVLRPGGLPLQPFIKNWIGLTEHFDRNEWPANLHILKGILKGITPVEGDKDGVLLGQALKEHRLNADLNILDSIDFRDDFVFDGDGTSAEKHTPAFERSSRILHARFGDQLHHLGVEPVSPSTYVHEFDQAQVPMYFSSGWMEGSNAKAAINRFMNYTAPGTKLILGPWDHCFFNISPFTFPGLSRFRIDREMLKFFDMHLKGYDPPDKAVHYYTLGEERWHASDSWPPSSGSLKRYLSADHELTADCQSSSGTDSYAINPMAGTGNSGRWDCLLGNPLLQPYANRKDADKLLLCYDSQPLPSNMRVTGQPSVNLFLKSNGEDCALFVYLEDVSPGGLVRYVTEGELLCGNQLNSDKAETYKTVLPTRSFTRTDYKPFTKDEVREVQVAMLPMSYEFKKGHRIRLSIAGCDKDHFKAPKFAKLGTQLTILRGGSNCSLLSLPVDTNKS
jgi:predicted acyl esterase